MSLTPIEVQEKYARLGEALACRIKQEDIIRQSKDAIRDADNEIKTLYAELGISKRRQRKIVEKKPRKSRSDKGTKRDVPPEGTQGTTTLAEIFTGEEKTREELEAEAKATATCPICKKLLKDCTCQVSVEAAEKHQKAKRK